MIIVDDKKLRTVPEQVSKNMEDIEDLKGRDYIYEKNVVDNLDSHKQKAPLSANQGRILKEMLNNAIAGVFHYKGSVATISDLPATAELGDTYNVLDTGNNYTWDGTGWDQLSGLVDLSAYYTKTEADDRFVSLTANQSIGGNKDFVGKLKTNGIYVDFSEQDPVIFFASGGYIRSRSVLPYNTNTYELGSSSRLWKNIYLSNGFNPNSGGYVVKLPDITGMNADDFLIDSLSIQEFKAEKIFTDCPLTFKRSGVSGDAQYHLEEDQYGRVVFSRTYNNVKTAYLIADGGNIQPNNTDALNFGASSKRFLNIFTANISDGADTATVADIAALIAYAKAQGWIS